MRDFFTPYSKTNKICSANFPNSFQDTYFLLWEGGGGGGGVDFFVVKILLILLNDVLNLLLLFRKFMWQQ